MSLEALVKIANRMDSDGSDVMAVNAVDMAISESGGSTEAALGTLAAFANLFDSDGLHSVADQIDKFIVVAATEPEVISKMLSPTTIVPDRKSLDGGGAPLSSRTSPDYPGVMMLRVSDGVYQDMMTKKIYDFNKGWVDAHGDKHPGGSISNQNALYTDYVARPQIFESRRPATKSK